MAWYSWEGETVLDYMNNTPLPRPKARSMETGKSLFGDKNRDKIVISMGHLSPWLEFEAAVKRSVVVTFSVSFQESPHISGSRKAFLFRAGQHRLHRGRLCAGAPSDDEENAVYSRQAWLWERKSPCLAS